jgi:hypothetical protein
MKGTKNDSTIRVTPFSERYVEPSDEDFDENFKAYSDDISYEDIVRNASRKQREGRNFRDEEERYPSDDNRSSDGSESDAESPYEYDMENEDSDASERSGNLHDYGDDDYGDDDGSEDISGSASNSSSEEELDLEDYLEQETLFKGDEDRDEDIIEILSEALLEDDIETLQILAAFGDRNKIDIGFSSPFYHEGRLTNPISLCKRNGLAYGFLRRRQKKEELESTTGGSSSLSSSGGGYRDLMQPFLDGAVMHKDSSQAYADSDQKMMESFNTPQKQTDKTGKSAQKLTPDNDKFIIPHFRGINFNRAFFSKSRRRTFGKESQAGKPLHSLTSFENSQLMGKLSDDLSAVEHQRLSDMDAKILKLFKTKLTDSGKVKQLAGKRVFENARDRMQQRYTNLKNNPMDKIWEGVGNLVKGSEFADLSLKSNPYISTGKTPEHAVRYALGLSFLPTKKSRRADPRYRQADGQAKYRLIGLLYVTFHTVDEYNEAAPGDVTRLNKEARIGAHVNYLNETEVSFVGGIKGENVAITMPILYPSFKKDWEPYYQEMYDLNQPTYNYYKEALMQTQRHAADHKVVKNEIREHLKEHYSAIAISLAKSKAEEVGKKLVYINPLGKMKPYEEKKLTGKSKSLSGEMKKLSTGGSESYRKTRPWENFRKDASAPDPLPQKLDYLPAGQAQKNKTAGELLQDKLARVSNPKEFYADDEMNDLLSASLAPDVEYITPAIAQIKDQLSSAITGFIENADKKQAVIAIQDDNHYTALHMVKTDDGKFALTYVDTTVDALSRTPLHPIAQTVMDTLEERFQAPINITKSTSYIQSHHIETDANNKQFRMIDNNHCGPFICDIMTKMTRNQIRINPANSSLQLLTGSSWNDIDTLDKEQSNKYGNTLRARHAQFINQAVNVDTSGISDVLGGLDLNKVEEKPKTAPKPTSSMQQQSEANAQGR